MRSAVAEALRTAAGATVLGRLCPRCGSGDHGRPWARDAAGPLQVSVSYAPGLALVAWSRTVAVGVDVVAADAVPPDGLTPGDWARLEALAKLRGTGLAAEVGPVGPGESLAPVPAPPGHVAWLARAGAGDVATRWVSDGGAGPAAPGSPATR